LRLVVSYPEHTEPRTISGVLCYEKITQAKRSSSIILVFLQRSIPGYYMKKIFLLPLLFITVLFSSCVTDFKEISISRIDGFKIKEMNKEGMKAEVTVTINNPNSTGFNVYRSACDVYYGGSYLGKAKLTKKVKIAPNSNVEHVFELSGTFKEMSLDLMGLLNGKGQSLELKGNLKAGKFYYKKRFPIDKKQKISPFK
jgi:LEA14-like dessication related protein